MAPTIPASLRQMPPPLGEVSPSISQPLSPSTPSTPGMVKGLNPLSSKVTAVLSTSHADSDFRDALSLLDSRALRNSPETRRQLRLGLQREVIDSNGDIISEFGRVADQLRRIGLIIDRLNGSYGAMKAQIDSANGTTSSVLGDATAIMNQRQHVQTKQLLLDAFQRQFVLSDDEIASLTLVADPVDNDFFLVLGKAKQISKNCEVLLGFENQTLGLDIMDQTSKLINLAFQKVYRWIQREFKTLNLENPRIGSAIRRALRVLAERPTLFQNCLDSFAEVREHILSDAFFTALTGSSASGGQDQSVKPIELAAHDPLRYVGDMLAWTHSAAVSEREALEVLFVSDGDELAKDIQAGRENEVWRLVAEDGDETYAFDAVKSLNDLVDRDVSGAVRILRQRVEQVIQTNEETILAYRLANLLNFYRITFAKLLGDKSLLVDSLSSLETEALRQFRSLVRDHITAIQGDFRQTPTDLGPPEFLQEALKQISSIMKTYDTSLTSSSSRESDFQPILAEAFTPFVEGCENMAKAIADASDGSIFMLNCLVAARTVLAAFDFVQGRVGELQNDIDRRSQMLVESQYAFFCYGSGLGDLFAALQPLTDTAEDAESVLRLKPLQPHVLVQSSQQLDDFLPSALMDAMENLKQIQDSSVARQITEEAAERFCVEFEHVEEMILFADEHAEEDSKPNIEREDGEEHSLRRIFPRTSGEIRVLLS